MDGRAWEVPAPASDPRAAKRICALLTGGPSPLPSAAVRAVLLEEGKGDGGASAVLEGLLVELLDNGFLYPLQVGGMEEEEA